MCLSTYNRLDYAAELCERLVPILEDESTSDGMESYNDAIKDLVIRLKHTAEWFRGANGRNEQKGN